MTQQQQRQRRRHRSRGAHPASCGRGRRRCDRLVPQAEVVRGLLDGWPDRPAACARQLQRLPGVNQLGKQLKGKAWRHRCRWQPAGSCTGHAAGCRTRQGRQIHGSAQQQQQPTHLHQRSCSKQRLEEPVFAIPRCEAEYPADLSIHFYFLGAPPTTPGDTYKTSHGGSCRACRGAAHEE